MLSSSRTWRQEVDASTVLLVEGGQAHRSIINRRLNEQGFSVIDCLTIAEAQSYVFEGNVAYAGIITDISTDVSREDAEQRIVQLSKLVQAHPQHPPILTHSRCKRVSGVDLDDFVPRISTPDGPIYFVHRPNEFGRAEFIDPFVGEMFQYQCA